MPAILIDVGNTNIKFGLAERHGLLSSFALPTDRSATPAMIRSASRKYVRGSVATQAANCRPASKHSDPQCSRYESGCGPSPG